MVKSCVEDRIKLNLRLPGYKEEGDLIELSQRVASFGRPIRIFDIGSYTGIATWHFAQNAPHGSKVYAIDPWLGEDLNPRHLECCKNYVPGMLNTFEHFKENVADCQGIVPLRGFAPECWPEEPADFIFIDLDGSPEDRERAVGSCLERAWQTLSPGGTLGGFHYAPASHPGYEETKLWNRRPVEAFARQHGLTITGPEGSWLWFYSKR